MRQRSGERKIKMERISKNAWEDICRLTIKQRLRKKATEMHESLRESGGEGKKGRGKKTWREGK